MSAIETTVAQGADWSADRYRRAVSWAKAGWALAVILLVLLVVVLSGAMVVWARLSKPVSPVVLALDHATGQVQALEVWNPAVEGAIPALQKFFVTQYVRRREGYLFQQLNYDYRVVDEMSLGQAQRSYETIYSGPAARHTVLQGSQQWVVHILSVELPPYSPGVAVVRFRRDVIASGGSTTSAYYTARLSFHFTQPHLVTEEELIDNPVGFKVTSYVADADLADSATPTSSTPETSTRGDAQ